MSAESILAVVIDAYPADCRPSRATRVAGGFSDSWIWRCQSPRGELAIRAWPEEQDRARIAWIHRFQLHLAANCSVAIAAPIATHDGATFVVHANRIWEIAPWLPGAPEPVGLVSATHRAAAVTALAQVHRAAESFDPSPAEVRNGPAPAVLRRRSDLQRLVQSRRDAWPSMLSACGWPEMSSLAFEWNRLVPRMMPIVDSELATASGWVVPLQACIRDIWSDHILFVDDRVSGIIDFGAAGWDTVACDLARLVPKMDSNPGARETVIAAYELVRPLSDFERRLIEILDRAAMLLGPALWFRWIAEEHRDFRDRAAVVSRVTGMLTRLARYAW